MTDARGPGTDEPAPDAAEMREVLAAADLRRVLSGAELRRQAEDRLDALAVAAATLLGDDSTPVPEAVAAIVHELRVHQVELEMQNEELRRAQGELEEQRAEYLDLFDLAPGGSLGLGAAGIIGDANLRAALLLGEERRRLVGRPFSAFMSASDADVYYRHRKALERSGEPQTCELRLRRVGAEPFWAQVELRPRRAVNGEPPGCRVTFTDIDARKLAEEALRASEERFRAVFNATHDLVSILRPVRDEQGVLVDEVIEWTNAAWRSWFGWADRDPGGHRLLDIAPWLAGMLPVHARVIATGEPDRADVQVPDGRWLDVDFVAFGDGLLAVSRDVTAERQAGEALRASEERYHSVVTAMSEGVVLQTANGTIEACDASAEAILGLSRGQMAGRTSVDPR